MHGCHIALPSTWCQVVLPVAGWDGQKVKYLLLLIKSTGPDMYQPCAYKFIEKHSQFSLFTVKMKWRSLSHIRHFLTPWTVHGILQARILEWVAYPFSRESSRPRNWTRVSHVAGGFLTNWAIREATSHSYVLLSHCEHRISEYWIITPRGDIGLGSCKSLVTCLKRNQYRTLFFMCFCLKTHYLIYVINAWTVKFTASRTVTDA